MFPNDNSPTLIVTCGGGFVDIDGFACAVAYAELLRLEGKSATAVLSDPLNASVTPEIHALGAEFSTVPAMGDSYVIVDMSDPEKIGEFAPLDKVSEVYDHHSGFEEYWSARLGERAKIEPIGAAATLIWEEFKIRGFTKEISRQSAAILAHAIVSNTVNFLVGFAHGRDKTALAELVKIAGLKEGWITEYFSSQQRYVEGNPEEAILNDTKFLSFPEFGRVAFGQSEIWDSAEFLNAVPLDRILNVKDVDAWMFNCVDIQKGETRIRSNHSGILEKLSKAFSGSMDGNELHVKKVVLRKEMLPVLRNDPGASAFGNRA